MKKISIALLILILILGLVEMAIQSHWGKEIARNLLMTSLEDTGFSAKIEKIEGTLPSAIVLKNINLESDQLSISAESLELNLSLFGLLKKELNITKLIAKKISVQEKNKESEINLKLKKEIPFGIKIKYFKLQDLEIPHFPKINLEGRFAFSKQRQLLLDTTITRDDFPNAQALLILKVKPNGKTLLKTYLKTDTIEAFGAKSVFDLPGEIHLTLQGPLSGFLEKKGDLKGQIRGMVTPKTTLPAFFQPYVEEKWIFSASILKKSGEEWDISNLKAKSGQGTLEGKGTIKENGEIQQAFIKIHSNSPKAEASIAVKKEDEQLKGKAVIRSPLLIIDKTKLKSIGTDTDFSWDGNFLKGNSVASGEIFSKIWTGKADFSWNPKGSLFLPQWDLRSSSIDLKGHLEIKSSQEILGETELNIENLQDISSDFYGTIAAKVKWKEGQEIELDGSASNFYWKELFSPSISFYTDIKNPFQKAQGNLYLDIELLKWRSFFLETTTLEIQSTEEGLYPFKFFTEGEWKHPLELHLDGFLNYLEPSLLCTIESGTGSFFKHPIALSHPVNLECAPSLFQMNGLDLTLNDAHLLAKLNRKNEETTGQLTLVNFPLDILSLNPLDVAIEGRTNIELDFKETNQKVSANFKALIDQLKVESMENGAPATASGKIEGHLDKERLNFKANLQIRDNPLFTCSLSVPLHLELWPLHGELIYENPVKGDLLFNGKIEEILDFFNLGTHYLKGNCNCNFHISRTLDAPKLEGYCHLENGYYENYFTGTQIREIKADWRGDKGLLILDSMHGLDGRGKGNFTAHGEIELNHRDLFPFHFDIDFHRFNSVQIDLATVEANGHITIDGNLKNAIAKGNVEVVESELVIPSHIPRSYPNLEVVYLNATKPVATPVLDPTLSYPLALDLSIQGPDSIFIGGRGLDSEWKGNFQIDGTNTAIAAKGKLELIKGNFVLSGRSFKLNEGTLSFTGRAEEMPYLNLAASMDVKDISIITRLKGPLNNPQITLQSIPPLPLSTIMAYLLFGQNLAEINSYQALQLANSLASLAGEGPDILESTRKSLGVDRLTIVTTPSDDDELSDRIALQVGKYISEGILVSFSQGAEDSSTNISIEIEMKNGFVFQLESDQKQNQGKFTLKWNHNY